LNDAAGNRQRIKLRERVAKAGKIRAVLHNLPG
jgi:hypothetical protein